MGYAFLIETIIVLLVWIGFIHWRLSKNKKELVAVSEIEPPDPFEIYLQYLNRELSETKSHLDKLSEESPDDVETINMYQYRLKHLDAEQKAMTESKGEVIKFWEIYHSNIEFVYDDVDESAEGEEEVLEQEQPEQAVVETPESMENELESYQASSSSIIEQSNNVIEFIQKYAAQNDSEELQHLLGLLTSEKEQLESQLKQMENEYNRLMNNAALQMQSSAQLPVSQADREEDEANMSKVLAKQNSRISELSDIVGNLSIELDDKKRLVEETEWVARQLKETEQVVVILEDENSFLRGQIKQLLDNEE